MTLRRRGFGLLLIAAVAAPLWMLPEVTGAAAKFKPAGTGGGIAVFIKFNSTKKRVTWRVVNLTDDPIQVTSWEKHFVLRNNSHVDSNTPLSLDPHQTCEGAADDPACADGPFAKPVKSFSIQWETDHV